MIKELKIVFYLIFIILFFSFTIKYYFSDTNKKNYFRKFETIDKKIDKFSQKIPIIKNDTINIIEYVDNEENNKKKFNFWKLLENDEK